MTQINRDREAEKTWQELKPLFRRAAAQLLPAITAANDAETFEIPDDTLLGVESVLSRVNDRLAELSKEEFFALFGLVAMESVTLAELRSRGR